MEIDSYDQAIANAMSAQQPQETQEATPDAVATANTEEQSVQSEETSAPEQEQQSSSNWNPQDFAFKADGKMVLPKSKEEAIAYMQQGYHYSIRAQKLNQREAELYAREQALKSQPQQQAQPQQEEEEFNPFAPQKSPEQIKYEQRLAQLEQQINAMTQKQESQSVEEYATQVDDFANSLANDFKMQKEEIDEFIWEAMQVADKFETIDDLKAFFYKTHPDAPEKRAKVLAETDINKFKQSMSHNTVVNSTKVGSTPTQKPKITSYEDAYAAANKDPRISDVRNL